ncbi:MAG: hypothetical protein WBA20_06215 [Ketobacter sp.]
MHSGEGSIRITSGFLRRLTLSYRAGLAVVLLVALITHLPFSSGVFSTDDYMIRSMVTGDAALYEKGFSKVDPDKSVWQGVMDAFHFYSPAAGTLHEYKQYGNLPWWSGDEAQMNPWRPVSALTHWVDYQIAPESAQFQIFHTLLYVLLFAYCGYRLFWRLSNQSSIAVLATLMLVVDFSHLMNFNWISARNVFVAGALGCATLEQFIVWRTQHRPMALPASLVLFALGLLSAESSVAVGGYVLAYLVIVERNGVRSVVTGMLPYAALVLLWRGVYSSLDYGASGISLYIDPGRTPFDFLVSLLQTLPLRYASVILTLDSAVATLSPLLQVWVSLGSLVLVLCCLVAILPLCRCSPKVRFMLLGSVLAAVPAAALTTVGPRSGLFIAVGFFWVLAVWVFQLLRGYSSVFVKSLAALVLGLHLFVPMVVDVLYTSGLVPVVYVDDQHFDSVAGRLRESQGEKSLVVVNPPTPNTLFYLPFEWQLEGGVSPAALNMLAPGFITFDLKRVSAQEFEITSPGGLPITAKQALADLKGKQPAMSLVYTSQTLQGLFVAPDAHFRPGQTFSAGNMNVEISAVDGGRVVAIKIRFDNDAAVEQMIWQRYDWGTREYRVMPVPAVGQTLRFSGPLDIDASDPLQLCLDCEEKTGDVIDRVDHN